MKDKPDYLDIQNARNGLGIFTKKEILPNEIIFSVLGEFMSVDDIENIGGKISANSFRFSEDQYISPTGYIGDYLNHSCEPNCYVDKIDDRLFVKAFFKISNGEEILLDYSTIMASDDTFVMICNCGSNKCREIIKKFDTLPFEIRENYLENHLVPEYIN